MFQLSLFGNELGTFDILMHHYFYLAEDMTGLEIRGQTNRVGMLNTLLRELLDKPPTSAVRNGHTSPEIRLANTDLKVFQNCFCP